MIESAISFLEEFRGSFRLVDLFDILLVSVFLYAAFVWFKETASRGILIGVGSLAVVYFVARAFDMYLTSLAFQTTFAILLFVLVVVFQEDLRRFFERLSAIRSVRLRQTPHADVDLDGLVEAAFKLASMKTGALIVLKGSEPLNRHLDSGIDLGGVLSRPLLYSIFDASSPGHDGAVIVNRNRIEQFGAHLPISKRQREIAGRGTRHSAALGLSERSDALTIVVSEESGVVSVAEGGKLQEVSSPAALKNRLEKFLKNKFPADRGSNWTRFVVRHGYLKLLAFTVAVIAWFALAYDPSTIQRTFVMPIEYRNLPTKLVLDESAPNEARITLSGSERDFRFLEPSTLRLSADLASAESGYHEVDITSNSIRVPANLAIYRIEPRIIRLFLRTRPPPEAEADKSQDTKSK